MFYRLAGIAALLTTGVALHADNIITITGTSPFGFTGQPGFVMAWNQTVGYTNVSIAAFLEDTTPTPLVGVEGTAYLTNQIGPSATSANNVAPPVSVTGLTGAFTSRTLFTGLTLPPGTYYLVLIPTNTTPMSMSPEGAANVNTTVTPGAGVSDAGVAVPSTVAGFPPASSVTLTTPDNIEFTVTGTLAPSLTPAPSSLFLMLTVLAGAGLWFTRRKWGAA